MRDFDEKTMIRTKWVVATCDFCGNEVEFGHSEKKIIQEKQRGRYIICDGKHFWDDGTGSPPVEMILYKNKKGAIKIMSVNTQNKHWVVSEPILVN